MIDGKGYKWQSGKASSSTNQPTYDGIGTMTGNSDNGYARIEFLEEANVSNDTLNSYRINNEKIWNYDFSNSYQEFIVAKTGTYKVELWGAQGGSYSSSVIGGLGSYTSGQVSLTKGTKLYIFIGGQGTNPIGLGSEYSGGTGGWNGGGDGLRNTATGNNIGANGGGGATDIRTVKSSSLQTWNTSESLISRIMVAAGGSGSANYNGSTTNGTPGGGLIGYNGYCDAVECTNNGGSGGTQISAGYASNNKSGTIGGFGYGGSGTVASYNSTGGGSGWYGGGGANAAGNGRTTGGSGSSYISGFSGCIGVTSSGNPLNDSYSTLADSISNTGYKFTNTQMIDGKGYSWNQTSAVSVVKQPTTDGTSTQTGQSGNGYAKITYLGA